MSIFSFSKKEVPVLKRSAHQFNLDSKVFHYSKIASPTFKENVAKGWVSYGQRNDYPETLLELLEGSALHNGITNGKSYLVSGDQFLYDGKTLDQLKEAEQINDYLNLNDFIENGYSESLYDIKDKIALDYIISGSYALKIHWSLNFSKIVEVEYVPWMNLRTGIKNEEGKIEHYYISEKWKGATDAEKYQAFNVNAHLPDGVLPDEFEDINDYPYDHTQILYVKNHFPGYNYYGRPGYIGAITEIKATNVLSNFYLSSIENGFTPSMLITFNEEPGSAEEGRSVTRRLEEQFTVKGIGRKLAVFFAKGKDLAPTFQTIDTKNIDAQMLQIQNQLFAAIIAGHSVTSPELVGVAVPGKLGSSDLEEAYKIFKNTVINRDKSVIERTFNTITSVNGMSGKITISDKNPLA